MTSDQLWPKTRKTELNTIAYMQGNIEQSRIQGMKGQGFRAERRDRNELKENRKSAFSSSLFVQQKQDEERNIIL